LQLDTDRVQVVLRRTKLARDRIGVDVARDTVDLDRPYRELIQVPNSARIDAVAGMPQ
jgi:hypothetical protein